ncbi:uncharacterized protein FOBCDRAFT_206874 [Fusarium oxysporum Fo47]|uniref:uncharacterized protein n=1 Tax=Fusarium oxysporum Fo47 TaxID=660027 RepID=UPI002869A96C|nr:uncharacterized protein FOBCDRAFT_206874 [Fusarium oxysporum Fo47]WJG36199.1 hypothetical protein FOBCDRAFT_206874 [Fusarium oxysporum Fo47]
MAMSNMISFSVRTILYDRQCDVRKYLVDAERLLLEQGLCKLCISGKIKLLHHTYIWNRIISESTYVLRNSDSANVPIAAHLSAGSDKEPSFERGYGSHMTGRLMIPNVNLDDFLHFEPHQQETDSSSRETGREILHDIHLKQDQVAKHGSKEDKPWLHEHIERRKGLLEHRICSFAMTGATTSTSIDSNYLADVYSQEGQHYHAIPPGSSAEFRSYHFLLPSYLQRPSAYSSAIC